MKERNQTAKQRDKAIDAIVQRTVSGWSIPVNHETFSAIKNAAVEGAKGYLNVRDGERSTDPKDLGLEPAAAIALHVVAVLEVVATRQSA